MTYTTTQSRWNTRVLSSSAQRGRGPQPGERDHVAALLAKANAQGKARPMTTRDTLEAMTRVQQRGAQYQPMETRR